jgi:hypothetical protein
LLACFYNDKDTKKPRLGVFSTNDFSPLKTFDTDGNALCWAGPKRLAYLLATPGDFTIQPLGGGPPATLSAPGAEPAYSATWSPDGKRLAMICGKHVNDAMLFRFGGK